ncbi:tRNA lysidine(34) synthetase TilS [Paractinoplanes durhamensis]|uniref:tRNA(Ile)-lysidine synthase n=1 Tax=Paractinoplanes durhamensis TaxID=113563 RepID=A0ABQ3Z7S4_9ACTN|nr:tRNA lysidine(34) synthetase TilS [Actinoplanes durhamensis]GIE05865.1 tRNA(Ile)-lysidine synthase [Actinoplanes durhamensis]
MARIPPSVAAVRQAVRRDLPPGLVLVACSGGADSLALAAAARFVGSDVGLVTVDHGLQDGSDRRALDVASWAREAGFAPVEVATVSVAGLPGGPEAAARSARYAALSLVATRVGAAAILLGHTRDDQAETVLLALARGAGPRGLSGMPRTKGIFRRPLLGVGRADTRKACAALGLVPWEDPHNVDPAFARSRVRGAALPALVEALGPAVVANLARSAERIAADSAALDALAEGALLQAYAASSGSAPGLAAEAALDVSELSGFSAAIRTRVLHAWAKVLGASGSALSHRHVVALDALVVDWHGQGAVHLPGGIRVARVRGQLVRVPD